MLNSVNAAALVTWLQVTFRHAGYAVSLRLPRRLEEIFGWMKTVGGLQRSD